MSTAVSPTISPEILQPLAPAFHRGTTGDLPVFDAGFSAAESALRTAHENAELGTSAAAAIKAASNDAGQERRLRAGWKSRFDSTLKSFDVALAKIEPEVAENEAGVDADLELPQARTDIVRNLRATSILGHLRSLGSEKAFAALTRAVAEGDREAVSVALAGSSLAAGLPSDKVALLRSLAENKWSSQRVAKREALRKLTATVERAREVFVSDHGHLLGAGDSPAARAEKALVSLEGGQR